MQPGKECPARSCANGLGVVATTCSLPRPTKMCTFMCRLRGFTDVFIAARDRRFNILSEKNMRMVKGSPCAIQVHGIKRIAYWTMAGTFLGLAMVGVILPGIPTTPFLLLMGYFLLRVSPSLHAKVLLWPVVGGPIRDWRDQGGIRLRVKILAYAMVTLLVGSTLIWSNLSTPVKVLILCAAIYGISVVVRLPRVRNARTGPLSESS